MTTRSCSSCGPDAHTSGDGVELAGRFYAVGQQGIAREVERRTLGCDFGANGYATLAEVDGLVGMLGLGPGQRLLDIGCGQGWPGLYLSRETGCTVVLCDVPFEGLATAARRAAGERLGARAFAVAARGQVLPLRPATFDAVIHTDVLCCLDPKLATLRATFRALRHGGTTVFTAIFSGPGLSAAETRRAIEAGPPNVVLRTSCSSLLRSAGFVEIEEHDLTADYLATARRKLEVAEQFAEDLIQMLGHHDFDETQIERRLAVQAITDGLLRRSLFVARRP
ncbi:MAG: class I SAM-dependent methyltransferase [Acidimicrobiales bacterium]